MKFTYQLDQMDCGPACLSMIANHYGKNYPLQYLRENSFITREGVSMLGIREAAQKIGFTATSTIQGIENLHHQSKSLPCILHWNKNHFVVLTHVKKKIFSDKLFFKIADPAHGVTILNEADFKKGWLYSENEWF